MDSPRNHLRSLAPILAPIGTQEVWAAGVTYYRSRSARIEESKDAGGGTFYDRVYSADRPELFFKATGRRVVGPGGPVRIRSDAKWSVPEPELTLVVNPSGKHRRLHHRQRHELARHRRREPPLPSAGQGLRRQLRARPLHSALAAAAAKLPPAFSIDIERSGALAFHGATTLAELKRDPKELVAYLFRDNTFPNGVFLMTGTGIVPDDDFTLAHGDIIRISIDGIGTLKNVVA